MFGMAEPGKKIVTLNALVRLRNDVGVAYLRPHVDPPALCSFEPIVEGELLEGENPRDALYRLASLQLGAAFAEALRSHVTISHTIECSATLSEEEALDAQRNPNQSTYAWIEDPVQNGLDMLSVYERRFTWVPEPFVSGYLLPGENPMDALHRLASDQFVPAFADTLRASPSLGIEHMFDAKIDLEQFRLMQPDPALGEMAYMSMRLYRTVHSLANEGDMADMLRMGT